MEIRRADERQVTIDGLRGEAAVEDPHVVLVRDAGVRFPAVCPNDSTVASQSLRIERAFSVDVSDSDGTSTANIVDHFDVPFCDACVKLWNAQREPTTPLTPLKRMFAEGEGAGGGIVAFVGLFFLKEAIVKLSLILLAFAALPLFVGYWLMRSTYRRNRHIGVPKPTPVESSIEFTPNLALPYESGWRAFQFRSIDYADAFRKLNEDRLWNPHSGEARAATAQRKENQFRNNLIIGGVVLIVLLYGLWREFFG